MTSNNLTRWEKIKADPVQYAAYVARQQKSRPAKAKRERERRQVKHQGARLNNPLINLQSDRVAIEIDIARGELTHQEIMNKYNIAYEEFKSIMNRGI